MEVNTMNDVAVDILLVEDNPNDAELALRALRKHNLANRVEWVKDGADALDFLINRVPPGVGPAS
jgi:two-component system, response regulator